MDGDRPRHDHRGARRPGHRAAVGGVHRAGPLGHSSRCGFHKRRGRPPDRRGDWPGPRRAAHRRSLWPRRERRRLRVAAKSGSGHRSGLRRNERATPSLPTLASAQALGMVFSRDNETLFAISTGGDIESLDLVGRSKLGRPIDWANGFAAAFSPDGTVIGIPHFLDNDVALVDVATAEVLHVLDPAHDFADWALTDRHLPPCIQPRRDPDRGRVRRPATGEPAEIEIFSVADGESVRRLPVPGVPFVGEPARMEPRRPGDRRRASTRSGRPSRRDQTGERLADLALPADRSWYFSSPTTPKVDCCSATYPGNTYVSRTRRTAPDDLRATRRERLVRRVGPVRHLGAPRCARPVRSRSSTPRPDSNRAPPITGHPRPG